MGKKKAASKAKTKTAKKPPKAKVRNPKKAKSGDTWYFAYGSNLLKAQKEQRTGRVRSGAEAPVIVRLKGFRLAFNKRGRSGGVFANIMPSPSDEVYGVAYRWSEKARRTMADDYEIGYVESNVDVESLDGKKLAAISFIAGPDHVCADGTPTPDYLARIVDGARGFGLPVEYIAQIEKIAAQVPLK